MNRIIGLGTFKTLIFSTRHFGPKVLVLNITIFDFLNLSQHNISERNYTAARYHYLHSSDGCGFATMLVELHISEGYSNEVDLFIAQVVLQYVFR